MLTAGLLAGWMIFAPASHDSTEETGSHEHAGVWTCSMHPSVRKSEPGKCPICGMDLVPLSGGMDEDPLTVHMSETAIKLANIHTTTISMGDATKEIRLNGKVKPDERRISSQTAHVGGRIDQLLVNFTGEYVQRGAVIARVYAPELITAQRELLETFKIRDSQPALYKAAREKLRNWKFTEAQIDGMLNADKQVESYAIHADVAGVVWKRNVSVGDYVERGASLFEVVDLSKVWITFDVYEADAPWVHKGDAVSFTVQSIPGETFTGTIDFIDPVLDPQTRVITARLEIPNPRLAFKPEMFVTGFVKNKMKAGEEIVLPKSAVLWTGARSLVYIKVQTDHGIGFQMKEVTLGPAINNGYVIKEGLEPGMEVVTNGAFTIDAAAQLAGKPSMMSPDSGEPAPAHQHTSPEISQAEDQVPAAFKAQLAAMLDAYLQLKDALVGTNVQQAKAAAKAVSGSLAKIDMKSLSDAPHQQWMEFHGTIQNAAQQIHETGNVEEQRKLFAQLNDAYFAAISHFQVSGLHAYYQFCPMAFNNKGGYWISKEKAIKNPYFGSRMMTCGEVKQELN